MIKERLHWPDNRDGTLWGVAAERAYEERQEIIERITRELTALKEAGKLTNRPPFGYCSAGSKYDHYLEPTDIGRKYVPLIFGHCIEGWSLGKIAKWLNDEGVKPASSKAWWAKSVSDIIKNPTYKGHRCERELVPPDEIEECDGKAVRYRYGSTWVETPRMQYGKTILRCEALVDAAVWKHANEALTTRGKRGHIDPVNRAMLAEALFCPFCEDSPMYRVKVSSDSRGLPYFYYRCAGRGAQRKSCGNMVRLELVDEAVERVMADTFDVPVMRHEIVYGNEAEIEAEIERIRFKLKQLAVRELDWEEEDRERAQLRAELKRASSTKLIDDRVELIGTDDTYAELWKQMSTAGRGSWLAKQGFRVTASRESVTVSQGSVRATVKLGEPEARERTPAPKETYWGKCECGCGTDLYGVKFRRKRYVDDIHGNRARARTRKNGDEPTPDAERTYWGKCECGCGTDLYGSKDHPRRYVDGAHRMRAQRRASKNGAAARADQAPI